MGTHLRWQKAPEACPDRDTGLDVWESIAMGHAANAAALKSRYNLSICIRGNICIPYRDLVPVTVWRAERLRSGGGGRYRIAARDA